LSLLRRLAQLSDTPIIALNHVVAVAMVDGAAAGLQRLETRRAARLDKANCS
jgi:predicted RNA polymerase sigma factor